MTFFKIKKLSFNIQHINTILLLILTVLTIFYSSRYIMNGNNKVLKLIHVAAIIGQALKCRVTHRIA